VAEAVSRQLHGAQRYSICQSIVRIGTLPAGAEIAVAQPQTYVNRSGDAVKGLLDKFKIPNSACLIVIDDLHLPIGALRFRRSGSDGGHNGLKSIISSIGSDFPRLRVGVGPLPPGGDTVAFVLGDFDSSEKEIIATAIAKAAEAVLFFVDQGIDKAMNRYNAG
jgi:PTH1 family peptidyl-tRNA hydrolase